MNVRFGLSDNQELKKALMRQNIGLKNIQSLLKFIMKH